MVITAFWVAFAVLLVSYVAYPLAMGFLARGFAGGGCASAIAPKVTVVIVARDEADVLAPKIKSVLTQAYPADNLDVVVVSDGSKDETVRVAKESGGGKTTVLEFDQGRGKASSLNAAMREVIGEIVVFSDARQLLDPEAVRNLVDRFADPDVGAVSGDLRYPAPHSSQIFWRSAIKRYWSYERAIRIGEAKIDSCVGVTGALFAIRAHLWRTLPEGLILDDVYTPMQIVLSGRRVVYEPAAVAREQFASAERTEFGRRVRTLTGNYQLLLFLPEVLIPFRNRIWVQFALHKLARLLSPFLFVVLLVSSAFVGEGFYLAAFFLQCIAWMIGGLSVVLPSTSRMAGVLQMVRAFTLAQVAAAAAFVNFVRGNWDVWRGGSSESSDGSEV